MWFNLLFSSLSQLWYVEVRISRSVPVSPLEFEITRVDCIWWDKVHFHTFRLRPITDTTLYHIMSHNVRRRTFWLCSKRGLKSACASAQSDKSSFSAWRNVACMAIQNAPREDSDQTARMRRLIWIFSGCTCPKVLFQTLSLLLFCGILC